MTMTTKASGKTQLEAYLRDVQAALRAGNTLQAMRLADDAVGSGLEHSHLLVLAAHRQLTEGAPEKALAFATRARADAPRNVDVLNVVGLSLVRLGRVREAVTAYDAALRQSPAATAVRFNRACALEELRELARARAEFERIVASEPRHPEAHAHLADLALQRRDVPSARVHASRVLSMDPASPAAHIALARSDIEEGKFEDARARIKRLLQGANVGAVNRAIAQGVLGDAYDGLGLISEAFDSYQDSQAILRAHYAPAMNLQRETARERALRLKEYFRGDDSWPHATDTYVGPVETHVFLVGFPRSGTSLLEQVLASHPDIETMEERDCLTASLTDFIVPGDGPERLRHVEAADLARYRDSYWNSARAEGAKLDKSVFVDKLPLNSVSLCVIARLFPLARILFALRDPRDVVFSCFRRRFVMTPQMFELTTLAGAADYYCAVMELWAVYRDRLGLAFCDTRYEDLVTGFDAECRKICAHIGVSPSEAMAGFAERARAGIIATPSAPQVARGLFADGMGQWRRYGRELAPVLPGLAPWVKQFGYPES